MARATSSSSAWGWLLVGGAALILVWIAAKAFEAGVEPDIGSQGSGPGGLLGWLNKLLGGRARNDAARDTDTQQDFAGPDHETGGVGAQAVTGHFTIASGDSINRELWAGTVRVPIALVNSGSHNQTVLVQVHCYWDFLVSDAQTTWSELIDVNGQDGKEVQADIGIPASVMISQPQLFLDLTVAGVHQDRVEHVQVV